MDITLTLEYGPLDVEFSGEDRDEVQSELLSFIKFIEDNEEAVKNLPSTHSTSDTGDAEGSQTPATEWTEEKTPSSGETMFSPVAERTRVDEVTLSEIFDVPEDESDPPHIKTYKFEEGNEVLGGSRMERQARASLMLLYFWQECRGEDEIESADLNDALSYSDVSPERRDNMYKALDEKADNYFKRNGVIGLSPPGEHAAREEIQTLAEKYESK